ncbi:MAG: ABC transporter ATP-binding protein [Flavobacteriales bacterium]
MLASGINVTVPPGIIVSMLDKNGIGKSTLWRTLFGSQASLVLRILLKRQNLSELSQINWSRYVSAILYEKFPSPCLTVGEFIDLSRLPHQSLFVNLQKQDPYYIDQALDLMKTTELEHIYILLSLNNGHNCKRL